MKILLLLTLTLAAAQAQPPVEKGPFLPSDLVEVITLDPSFHLDIRYATVNNFMHKAYYTEARAFLQRPAAEAVLRAHRKLKAQGYGILIHDAYRPWTVTNTFWEGTTPEQHKFLANPKTGSRHNRGCAVDLTLYSLKTGKPIQMPGDYDEMTPRSFPTYTGGTAKQRARRDLLRRTMESEGFKVNDSEWWHFDYKDWPKYPILDKPFESL